MLVTPTPAAVALLTSIEESPLAQWFRATTLEYPLVYTAHLVAIALLFGPIALWDWRVLRGDGTAGLEAVRRTATFGVALVLPTGALLFLAKPVDYAFNAAFQWKLLAIALSLCNVAVAHAAGGATPAATASRRGGSVRSAVVRSAALASLLGWLAVIGLGRWIAFV